MPALENLLVSSCCRVVDANGVIVVGIPLDMCTVLNSSDAEKVNFNLCGISVVGRDYKKVAKKLLQRKLRVVQSPLVPTGIAIYQRDFDVFIVKVMPSAPSIIHEGTHAIHDLEGRPIPTVDDEIVGYVAQTMYYLISRNVAVQDRAAFNELQASVKTLICRTTMQNCDEATFLAAGDIASDLMTKGHTDPLKVQQLRDCISLDPKYRQEVGLRTARYNGVSGQAIPASVLARWQGTILAN
jgi:hypothetical protein